jgi:hypothetical protein
VLILWWAVRTQEMHRGRRLTCGTRNSAHRVAVESLPILGAAARRHAGRSHGRQCSNAAASSKSSSSSPSPPFTSCATVAAASPSPPLDSSVSGFLRVFYLLPSSYKNRWLFLIGSAVPEGKAARTTAHHHAVTQSEPITINLA